MQKDLCAPMSIHLISPVRAFINVMSGFRFQIFFLLYKTARFAA